MAATACSASAPPLEPWRSHDPTQGHHSRRWLRHPAVSDHQGCQQEAAAGVRQADDLLPAQRADARGHP
ncbi:hypothetical protein G6F32_014990 [Rhizopus arrhizus]|nr:hypothetical protein G6F32_014990 [Rhizopus arrhizus]